MTFSLIVIRECFNIGHDFKFGITLKYSSTFGYLRPPNVSMSVMCSIFILANCQLWPEMEFNQILQLKYILNNKHYTIYNIVIMLKKKSTWNENMPFSHNRMSRPQSHFGYFPFGIIFFQLKSFKQRTRILLKNRRILNAFYLNKCPSQSDLCTTRVFGIIRFSVAIIRLCKT